MLRQERFHRGEKKKKKKDERNRDATCDETYRANFSRKRCSNCGRARKQVTRKTRGQISAQMLHAIRARKRSKRNKNNF